jgi:hypothetical protein
MQKRTTIHLVLIRWHLQILPTFLVSTKASLARGREGADDAARPLGPPSPADRVLKEGRSCRRWRFCSTPFRMEIGGPGVFDTNVAVISSLTRP